MSIAVRANCRTTQAAISGLSQALGVAISGGAVMGISVVGLALLGLSAVYIIFKGEPLIINGYAMGASLMALFARSGGGIFTKGADMGADLVGKVEANIPEDDPRNPAVIADNVGDNVGDVAGLGADLLESYVEAIIATIAITVTMAIGRGRFLTFLPLYIASSGVLASILGVLFVKVAARDRPQEALIRGTYLSAGLTAVFTFFIIKYLGSPFSIKGIEYAKFGPFWAVLAGLFSGVIVGLTSEYFTSSRFRPVRKLAQSSQAGPAVTITEGLAVGMESTALPVLILALAVLFSYKFAGIYGVTLAALGMLSTTGMVVSVDSYGPIADNAGGIAEMAKLEPEVRKVTDKLDAVGNTTAAIGKGFAIGSAAFAAIGLFAAYIAALGEGIVLSITDPRLITGILIGGMLPFLFSSMLFRAVGRCASQVIEEARRQFKEIPGLMEGKAKPDSVACVDISAKSALKGMLLPGVMAVGVPLAVGKILGPVSLGGLLLGALVTGLQLGIQTANSGGALDNAKKYIEEGNLGGKGSDTHKAAVIGDTVGDPLKDTVGPSINILIKLMAVISLVFVPLFI
jgi:K(+)-stimulated pyrophosphate-energized sodium pump